MGSVDTRLTEEDPENDHHLTTPADSHFAKHEAELVAEVFRDKTNELELA